MSFFNATKICSQELAAPLQQSPLYTRLLDHMGQETLHLALRHKNSAAGSARFIMRTLGPLGKVALLPKGPIWRPGISTTDRRAQLGNLMSDLRPHGVRMLITNAASQTDADALCSVGHISLITGQYEARLDLRPPQNDRRAMMRGKWRNRLVRGEKSGMRISHSPLKLPLHDWVLMQEAKQRRKNRYRALPFAFTHLAAEIAPDQTRVFVAHHNGHAVAAMVFLLHAPVATYHIGCALPTARAISAHHVLLWHASNWLAKRGYDRLDLGTIDTDTSPGLARFKLGSGANAISLGATCIYTPLTAPLGRIARFIKSPIAA